MSHHAIPWLRDLPGAAKFSLSRAKGMIKHSDKHTSDDIACLKKAGESEEDVRAILTKAGFSAEEADAALAPHYPPAP